MARPLRLSFENAVYHITARGNRRDNIFYSETDKAKFLEKMNETFEKYSFVCYAYCLMDNHYHLFVKTLLSNITDGMHYLNTSYSNWFKAKYKIVGVVFQGRYKSILVEEDTYCVKLSSYIHLNPVRARIIDNINEYEWSSFLDYTGNRKSIERLDVGFILRQFDTDLDKATKKYERFVLTNIDMDNPLEDSFKGIAVGGKAYIDNIKEKIKLIGKKREIGETKFAVTNTAEEIINVVKNIFAISKEEIFYKQKGNKYRQLAIYLMKKYTCLKLKEIGKLFEMDYAAISQAGKRYEEEAKTNKKIFSIMSKAERNLKKDNVKC